ncbi:hypothetical protein MNBD_GAMMA26-2407 [hydrothermal vent metagenome]|uniref:Uncharacterized protein n=1 Tax=hydrothermal vent metagenome TaxID=652676 RepID=A0A3B1BJA9_9ZZZZ
MANDKYCSADIGDRALEMIMQEVLHGMEECMLEAAYSSSIDAGFEVIEICPPLDKCGYPIITDDASEREYYLDAEVINFPSKNKAYG